MTNRVTKRKAKLRITEAERKVLLAGGFSPQLINHWRRCDLPSKRMAPRVSQLLKRPLLDVLYGPRFAEQMRRMESRYCA